MKIGFSTEDSAGLSAIIKPQFESGEYFTFVELMDNAITNVEIVQNTTKDQGKNAGVLMAKTLSKNQINLVIGENYERTSAEIMRDLHIKRFDIRIETKITVRNALDQYFEFVDKNRN